MESVDLELIAYKDKFNNICFIESNIQKIIIDLLTRNVTDVKLNIIDKSVDKIFNETEINRYTLAANLMYQDIVDENSSTNKFLQFYNVYNKHDKKEYINSKAREFTKDLFERFINADKNLNNWLNDKNKGKFFTYVTTGPEKPKNFHFSVKFYMPENAVYKCVFTNSPFIIRIYDCGTNDVLNYFLPRVYQTLIDNNEFLSKRPDVAEHLKKNWRAYCCQATQD